ncbi:hypothetical protein CFBP3846_P400093 (plasmid) [Pseudomonas syringae pv. avii]|uniref:Uncharacterized protein n=1 Tax=Pseudomonas syringae pv. avii TaxID=663959 RepID=A0ABY1UG19_PSESX|nr:hypothetical protein CFBP3846_P400093 [Pseudomonas syringae pv. avii]
MFKSDGRPRAQLTNKIMAAVPKPTNMIACQLRFGSQRQYHLFAIASLCDSICLRLLLMLLSFNRKQSPCALRTRHLCPSPLPQHNAPQDDAENPA